MTAETIATYASEYFAGRAAVTRNLHGNGKVYYIGTVLDEQSTRLLLGRIALDAGIGAGLELPDGVEIAIRSADKMRITFVLNLSKEVKQVRVPVGDYSSAFSNRRFSGGEIQLEPRGVEILVQAY
ncbi:MAG TPA: beta-galactosidase trimerization domain-containing protein [Trinickia sp.]|uniref:beta-galactosidase trimerization domain-containing protein n=1 Tax=Trinickia sp. TaxID=2571163 RepID=UPI002D0655BB|nr:beta-galactosidase trimerization domain-containing protein [Trinickia sp.]HVW50274.1 beta-galactosidase trimerization domain-containing protein [Trinickia sp.]